ncbi:LmbU family transcriptional regulator [Nocardia sp. NPDC060256]|uniref:LmbU family transcriptional regulator n=1 Tax=unclassified Nocardia TaxID=2637762 RepID=UPI00366915DE
MTRVGAHIPEKLTFEMWERAGQHLSVVVDSSTWCLGDWLVYGKRHFPDRYEVAVRAAGLRYQTLRNYAWVARRFPLEQRRTGLSFQHHAEVASLPVDEQNLWLDEAERLMWTTKQLRTQIRNRQTLANGPAGREQEQAATDVAKIAVASTRLPSWRQAADNVGIEFDEWVTMSLDRAAEQALCRDEQKPA